MAVMRKSSENSSIRQRSVSNTTSTSCTSSWLSESTSSDEDPSTPTKRMNTIDPEDVYDMAYEKKAGFLNSVMQFLCIGSLFLLATTLSLVLVFSNVKFNDNGFFHSGLKVIKASAGEKTLRANSNASTCADDSQYCIGTTTRQGSIERYNIVSVTGPVITEFEMDSNCKITKCTGGDGVACDFYRPHEGRLLTGKDRYTVFTAGNTISSFGVPGKDGGFVCKKGSNDNGKKFLVVFNDLIQLGQYPTPNQPAIEGAIEIVWS